SSYNGFCRASSCGVGADAKRAPDGTRCRRAPLFALSASSDLPFGASYSCAPRALHGMPNASTVRQNRDILCVKGMSNASYYSRDYFPNVSLKTKIMGPVRVCRKSVIHLKVDAEIPDVHSREPLGE